MEYKDDYIFLKKNKLIKTKIKTNARRSKKSVKLRVFRG